jgi:putative Ca2+/H+ antiporter (TMEM165/GDT1 family)
MGDLNAGLLSFAVSVGAVTLAEMGDKTQLLAMAFATRYKASKVLIGVFIATVLNHALAVAVGSFISRVPGLDAWIQGLAALSFVFFGLWTLKGDKLDEDEVRKKKNRHGAIVTVAIAFFIAEIGDKTQLATIALAARFSDSPVWVLAGTTMGMLIADAIGIIVGVALCRRIPERTVKIVSAAAFVFFGFFGGYQVLRDPEHLALSVGVTLGILAVIAAVTGFLAVRLMKNSRATESEAVAAYCAVRRPEDAEDSGEETAS